MVRIKAPLQLLVTNLDYDEHKGRICIGRITSGKISKGESVAIAKPGVLPCTGADPWPLGNTETLCRQNIFAKYSGHEADSTLSRNYTPYL